MLNTQDLANYLTEQLNAIGASRTEPYEFSLIAELRGAEKGNKVKGVLRTSSVEFVPVNGYVEGHYVFAIDFVLSAQTSNYDILQVNDIVGELVKNMQGTSVTLGNGNGVITLSTGIPGRYEVRYGAGESVPLSITARVTYTENAVTSADKHWLLDGVEIAFLRESVTVEQEGMQRKVYTEKYTKTILTGHTKYYNFRIPYESDVYKSLQQEILQTPDLRHTLTYYDGAAFTQENPFTADVVIFRSANDASEKPEGSWFDVTFTDAYDSIGKALQYELALIDFPFYMNGEDTRYFARQAAQQAYFEQKAAASSAPFVEIDAPTLDNLMITRQVYKNSTDGMSQFDYASKNYAIVKITTASATKYFYYFVENCTIGSNGQVIVDLRMDTVQTYFFDPSVTFSDCMIERAHLNRFEDAGNGMVKFVSDPASKIFNSEDGLNFPKRMVNRTKLNLQFTGNAEVDAWLNENVAYWVYVFIAPDHAYSIANIGAAGNSETSDTVDKKTKYVDGRIQYGDGLSSAAYCISYPIYRSGARPIYVRTSVKTGEEADDWTDINITISSAGRDGFEELNDQTSYYYVIKISMVPPFRIASQGNVSMSIEDGRLIIPARALTITDLDDGYIYSDGNKIAHLLLSRDSSLSSGTGYGSPCVISTNNARSSLPYGVFFGGNQATQMILSDAYSLGSNEEISVSDIVSQQSPNMAYNPKLNGQNFKELQITAANGESFTYDFQKLVEPSIVFEYSEPVVPEITRYYMRVQGGTGLYVDQTDENYMGLVGSTDNSLAFTNDQYSAFIANNKNFFMQSNLKIGANLAGGLLGAAGKAVSGAITGAAGGPVGSAVGAVIGGVSGVVSSVISAGISFIDRSLTVDNMKNAPDQMKNANGNIILNLFATELGLYVEEYSALDGDLKTANDFMDLYGFTFSSVGNVRDYANIRKYHNYIKAQLQSIIGNLSNAARNDLQNRFANGIRFWNSDSVSYEYENYENWLDN